MRKQLYIAAALQLTFCWVLPAQTSILFQTTTPPSAGQPSGGSISTTAFIGNYFTLNAPAHIDSISTAASVTDNGSIFGAILSVPNLSTLPSGTPFGAASPAVPLATAILRPTSTNAVVSGPVSVDLIAGTYVVVFGTGQFSATSGAANLAVSDGTKTSLPTGTNQVSYGRSCNNGTTDCWNVSFPAPSPFYFAVSGSTGSSSITSLNPNFAAPGANAFTLQVNGTGFLQNNSIITWNGMNLSSNFVSATQLTAVVPSNLLATAGTASVAVVTNGLPSGGSTFIIGSSGGPSISSINPTALPPGSGSFTLIVNGAGFVTGAVVLWNDQLQAITNTNSSTQITVLIPAAYLTTAGTATVKVQNPNGLVSNTIIFTIGTPSSIPTLTSVSPTSATVGGAAFTLTVSGTNFNSTSAVLWNNTLLPTTYGGPTQLTATVAAPLIASAGSATISVNSAAAGTSNTLPFPIVSLSAPAISSLNPASVPPNSQAFLLTVFGSNFSTSSAVLWNGTLLATSFINATQLMANVPASLVTTAGTANITVQNPGAISNVQPFIISSTPTPVLSSLSPSSAAPGGPNFTFTVNGSNFSSSSAILWNGQLLPTTFISAMQLSTNVPAGLIANVGSASVTVSTPNSGTSAQTSAPLTFSIAAPTGPTITTLSPASTTPGGASFILTVTGTGFTSASTVQWNGNPLVTIVTNATQLQASVSNALLTTAGTASVTVITGTTTSNALTFTIGAANTPNLTSLSPFTTAAGGPQFTLSANGSNFVNGATVVWNGSLLVTTFVSASQLTAVVPATLIASAGTATVGVTNPSGTSNTSANLPFTITPPSSATISSLTPATATAGGAQFTLTVNGQGFLSGAAVRWNNSTLTTTLVSATQLTATVPASLITAAGASNITVANPGGGISNSLTFTINSLSTSTTIFQTTLPPTPGQPASASLSQGQFLGNYFVLNAPTHIDSISTYAQTADGGTIFGAILSVPSLTSPPSGNPLDGTTLVSATLRPGASSSIVTAPVSVDLPAGTYVIVFGSGYFGATSTSAFAAFSNGGSANVPNGWNQVGWGFYCAGGLTVCWSANFTLPSQFYFAVTGTSGTTGSILSITGLNPAATTAGSTGFTLTVNGTGFGPGSSAQWNGAALPTQVINATQLNATVSANLVASVGTASVTVLNPNGSISNASNFTISSPVFSITSLNPPSATAGGPGFQLTVNGTGFSPGATLNWNGSPLTTTFVSSTQLTINVPSNLITSAGTNSLAVLSAGGQFSNFVTFTVNSATPNITSLSPNTALVGSSAVSVSVIGTGFLTNSSVLWGGQALPTTYISGTQLNASVSAALLANVGTANVTVQNGTSVSNGVAFSVTSVLPSNQTAGLAHYAVGQNFTTALFIINSGASTANYAIAFYDDNGNPAALPFSTGSTTRLSGTLPPYGSVYLEASNPTGPLTAGWGQITADASVVVQSLFRSTLNNTRYEAAVASSTGSRAFELPFDATNFSAGVPLYTGIAIANLDTTNNAQVSCIARDASGNTIPNGITIPVIARNGHWAGFQFNNLTGQRGTLDCTSTTNVAVIALRFIGTDTFSSLPVIKK